MSGPLVDAPEAPEAPTSAAPVEGEVRKAIEVQSSWWDYLGFGNNARENEQSTDAATHEAVASPNISEAQGANESRSQEAVEQPSPEPENPECAETPAATTVPQLASESAWYSPWQLYNWYTQPSASPDAPSTAAEQVKDEAVTQSDQAAPDTDMEPKPTIPATSELPNPITASIAANSKGWAAFFSSSRPLAAKMITERGEAGMEVMNIDDDEFDSNGSVPPTPAPTPVVTVLEKNEKYGKSQTPVGKTPSIRSFASSSSKGKDVPLIVPLTSSDSTKRKVAAMNVKRPASPAPSKKSVTPVQPRPPNLVLPTFNDTFRSLPRSRPPPAKSPTSTLMKTWGYVNSLLLYGAHDEQSGSIKGKGKERRHLEEFGKELPRVWDVLGGTEAPLADCKKVVVIGIHGWFPGELTVSLHITVR